MNALEAMKKAKQGKSIKRKLDNGITEVKTFYINGTKRYHYFDDENEKYHGEFKWWREDGTLGGHSNYKNGKRHGECKWWWKDGTLAEQKNYKDGKNHGEYKWWRENGTLGGHELYEDGELIKDYLK